MQYKPGDILEVKKDGKTWKGVLMPGTGSMVLKHESGYNIGINATGAKIKKIGAAEKPKHKPVKMSVPASPGNPLISVLSTGGTISSSIDYSTGGIYASYSAEDLLSAVPEIARFVRLKSRLVMNIMSEDVIAKDWQKMAAEIAKEINSGAHGIVVTHGTDTLVYSTSMMAFMLRDLPVPVVFTYAQKSSDRGASDAFLNMLCAAIVAGHSNIAEVVAVGHGSESDDFCLINRGTKVRKMHSSRRDSFRPINELPIGKAWPNGNIEIINENYAKRGKAKTVADTKIEEKVGIVKFYANASPEIIDFHVKAGYKGIIIQGTGLGHVSVQGNSFIKSLKDAVDSGVFVGMTTQEYGSANPYVYTNLRKIADTGVAYLADMTTECAYTKLMWVLGHTKSTGKAKDMMLTNMSNELNERMDPRAFLY